MSAYDTPRSQHSAGLLELKAVPSQKDRAGTGPDWVSRSNGSSIADVLLDQLAARVADAIVERLGSERGVEDEWLDSRQAAEYLGLHRDTLRRVAAARTIPSEQDGRGCRRFFWRAGLDEWRRSGGRSRHLAAVAAAA